MTDEGRMLAGVLLLSLVTVETGGLYLVRLAAHPGSTTPFQQAMARAGHAHAGVLLVLALLCQYLTEEAGLDGAAGWLSRTGVAASALLMPAGFFFGSMGSGRTTPNKAFWLVYAGALLLAVTMTALGIALVSA